MDAPTLIRPAEEVVGAFVPITLAGKVYQLRELPRGANREWQAYVSVEVRKAIAAAPPIETADQAIEAIAASGELMLDLLISYDIAGEAWPAHTPVLPDRDWINDRATDRECYEAMKKVAGVAFPPGADLLRLLPELRPWLLESISRGVASATMALGTSSLFTSSARRNTTGVPTTSKPVSPTRSSSRTSTKRSTAATRKARRPSTASPSA